MPNWYPDYDDRDTPDGNDVARIAERERSELSPHIGALPSHYKPGRFYMPYDMDGSFFLDIDEMNEHEFESYYRKQQSYKQKEQSRYTANQPTNVTSSSQQPRNQYPRYSTDNSKPTAELPPPTCNCCNTTMTPRMGRFGKFYFCNNGCESQPTISDKAWRSNHE